MEEITPINGNVEKRVPERVSNLCANPLNVPKVAKADKYSSNSSNDLLIEM